MKRSFAAIFASILTTAAVSAEGVVDLLPDKLLDAKGKKIEGSILEGKYVGLYFSAHWCPPCRAFTPKLVEFRNRNSEENFEVVFVSFDRSNTEKQKYIRSAEMEWPSIKGAGNRTTNQLAKKFDVSGFPTLVILDPNGKIITLDGISDVIHSPETALEMWKGEETS